MADKLFARGIFAREPHEKAPEFVKCELSFKVEDATAWLEEHANNEGWVKVTVKASGKTGAWYCEKNAFVPQKQEAPEDPAPSIPF